MLTKYSLNAIFSKKFKKKFNFSEMLDLRRSLKIKFKIFIFLFFYFFIFIFIFILFRF